MTKSMNRIDSADGYSELLNGKAPKADSRLIADVMAAPRQRAKARTPGCPSTPVSSNTGSRTAMKSLENAPLKITITVTGGRNSTRGHASQPRPRDSEERSRR